MNESLIDALLGCAYICPEEVLPGLSVVAGIVGLLLVFWNEIVPLARRLRRRPAAAPEARARGD